MPLVAFAVLHVKFRRCMWGVPVDPAASTLAQVAGRGRGYRGLYTLDAPADGSSVRSIAALSSTTQAAEDIRLLARRGVM